MLPNINDHFNLARRKIAVPGSLTIEIKTQSNPIFVVCVYFLMVCLL